MGRRIPAILVALTALAACGATPPSPERTAHTRQTRADKPRLASPERTAHTRHTRADKPRLAFPLPERSHLSARARDLAGPRASFGEHTHGRTLTMYGTAGARTRVLVAGCVNGRRCAGTDVVNAAMIDCPPPDAEFWYFASLKPRGADLDDMPEHPGAAAFRQAVADLRPTVAIVFRTGSRAVVHAAGPSAATGRRYARLAGLPFVGRAGEGLAPWTSTALPRTASLTVTLPPGRASKRFAARLAYAIDRVAGTRFADGANEDRRRMIASGQDPRLSRR